MAAAAASESDLSLTPTWTRSSFSKSFKRKSKSKKGSDAGSVASENATPEGSPYLRRNSTDSGRKLSIRLGGKKRSKAGLGRTESESGSSVVSQTPAEEKVPPLPAGAASTEEEGEYYTEEEEDTTPQKPVRPTLSAHNSHIGYLTASSPLITTETVDSSPPLPDNLANSPEKPSPSSRSQTLQAPTSSARRSPSPVGRLKEAFKVKRTETSPAGLADQIRAESEKAKRGFGYTPPSPTKDADRGRPRKDSLSRQIFEDKPIFAEPGEKTPSPAKARKPRDLVTKLPSTPLPGVVFEASPATVVTPPTPTLTEGSHSHSRNISADSIKAPESAHTSTSTSADARSGGAAGVGVGISHRRVKSAGQPSKLSNAISAPLTPAIEEVKTPGGTVTSPVGAGGFFSSMFSAAQSAANSLTNTIAVTGGGGANRNRSSTDPKTGQTGGEEVILSPASERKEKLEKEGGKQLAIETLGTGNLSLSHLGISESTDISPMNSSTELVSGIRRDEAAAREEEGSAARAVSRAYTLSESVANGDASSTVNAKAGVRSATPSVVDTTEMTPTPTHAGFEQDTGSIRRAGSVRSRLSGRRRARTRGSSAATGATMAPTISGPGSTIHKLPGFSVAPQKRQRDFHNLFRSVPEDDYLIEDYSAALQRDILLQGRMYISEGHICFSSNILGWVTNLVMSFDEIISVEKKATAMIFQNGVIIQTLQAKNVFASLLARDTTYDLIISIWKITHPNLRSTINGAPVEGTGSGDKTEKVGQVAGEESDTEEIYDEDEEGEDDDDEDGDEDGEGSLVEPGEGASTAGGSESAEPAAVKVAKRLSSNPLGAPLQNGTAKTADAVESAITGAAAVQDFPGPATHAPTSCGDETQHLERLLIEDTIPAPLGKIYSLMFGPASSKFMRKWLIEDQKSLDLQMEDSPTGLDNEHKTTTFSYIKPLSGSIGPKQTKCIINSTLEQFDLSKAVTVSCATQNPDVPSGNIFVVKTRYCLSWAQGGGTRFTATCQIEWSGKSWLKGPIEKGANDGQLQYQKDILAALKAAVAVKGTLKAGGKGKKGGRKRKGTQDAVEEAVPAKSVAAKAAEPNWGLFEPLRGPLGPVADLVHPSVIIAVLVTMVFVLWWRLSAARAASGSFDVSGIPSAQRVAAYEELWRREESELWNWLEQRAGVQEGGQPAFLSSDRQKYLEDRRVADMKSKVKDSELEDRRMQEAIKVTRERLEALEAAVKGRKGKP